MINRDLAEQAYRALAEDDLDTFLGLIDPNVEFTSLIAEAEGRTYHGHDGVREWWANIKGSLGGLTWEVEEIREIGDDCVLVRMLVTGQAAGAPVTQRMFQVVRGPSGKVTWWGVFRTEGEALGAVEERCT